MANLFNLPEAKRCKECGKIKPLTDFRKRKANSYNGTCQRCLGLRAAANVRASPTKKAINIIANKRCYTRKRGIKFDLTVEWYMERLNRGVCEVTGLPMYFNHDYGNAADWHQPSIDRINPGGDYTKKNCRLVCRIFNNAKAHYSEDILYDMCKSYLAYYESRHKKAA